MAAFLLLLLPALAIASIDVEVTGQYDGKDESSMKVYYSGSQSDIISNEERRTFNVGDQNIKDAVEAYFGKRPDDAYLRGPTPYGDLYSTNDWNQVVRTLVPKSARILKTMSEPQILRRKIFENSNSQPGLFDVGIHQDVEETVSSSWSQSHPMNISQDIAYSFDLAFKLNRQSAFAYTAKYGQNYKKSRTVTVGAPSSINLYLQPGQSAVATLEATKATMLVEIEYEANLSGDVAVNYAKTYKGKNFWALNLRRVMEKGDLSNKMMSKEVIEINFYTPSKVYVDDKAYGQRMMEVLY